VIANIEEVQELIELGRYIRERERILNQRSLDAKAQAKWDKIAALEIGARVVVNAAGHKEWSRGTELEFTGHKRVRLQLRFNGKTYFADKKCVNWFDLKPLAEFNAQAKHPHILPRYFV
jgi:hypothetical protein